MAVIKHPPHLIRSHAFRVSTGMGLFETHYAIAERKDGGRYDIALYVDFPTGRDRVVDKQGLDLREAVDELYEWEREMRSLNHPRSTIAHEGSVHFADACRQMGISHPDDIHRSVSHAARVKQTYIDKRRRLPSLGPGMKP